MRKQTLAASMFAEFSAGSCTKRTGEVEGWISAPTTTRSDIERKVPSAKDLKPTRYEPYINENGRFVSRKRYSASIQPEPATTFFSFDGGRSPARTPPPHKKQKTP